MKFPNPSRIVLLIGIVGGLLVQSSCANAADPVRLDVPYVPTPQAVVDRMLELGEVDSEDYVIDLGSGDGRIPVTAASRYRARALGVDIDPQRIREAEQYAREARVSDRVEFRQEDLFQTPIAEATVLTMYLLPSVNLKLRPRILEELKPGTRVVSHAFNMGDWEPDQRDLVQNRSVFLWIVPARVAGEWRVTGGAQPFTLTLEQKYQKVTGSARVGGRTVPLSNVELTGDELRFQLGDLPYVGRVRDGMMEALSADGAVPNWRAIRE